MDGAVFGVGVAALVSAVSVPVILGVVFVAAARGGLSLLGLPLPMCFGAVAASPPTDAVACFDCSDRPSIGLSSKTICICSAQSPLGNPHHGWLSPLRPSCVNQVLAAVWRRPCYLTHGALPPVAIPNHIVHSISEPTGKERALLILSLWLSLSPTLLFLRVLVLLLNCASQPKGGGGAGGDRGGEADHAAGRYPDRARGEQAACVSFAEGFCPASTLLFFTKSILA